eukprot:3559394-Prymnesium_polylepis.1
MRRRPRVCGDGLLLARGVQRGAARRALARQAARAALVAVRVAPLRVRARLPEDAALRAREAGGALDDARGLRPHVGGAQRVAAARAVARRAEWQEPAVARHAAVAAAAHIVLLRRAAPVLDARQRGRPHAVERRRPGRERRVVRRDGGMARGAAVVERRRAQAAALRVPDAPHLGAVPAAQPVHAAPRRPKPRGAVQPSARPRVPRRARMARRRLQARRGARDGARHDARAAAAGERVVARRARRARHERLVVGAGRRRAPLVRPPAAAEQVLHDQRDARAAALCDDGRVEERALPAVQIKSNR